MVELTVHEVLWCAHHGHPVLTLRTVGRDRYLAVAVAVEDAQALAVARVPGFAGGARAYDLVEATVRGLGARLTGVDLHVGPDAVLRTALRIDGPSGRRELPAHFADGIILAWRAPAPLRMAEADLERVPGTALPRLEPGGPHPTTAEGPTAPPVPFRDLIAALDLSGLGAGEHPARGG